MNKLNDISKDIQDDHGFVVVENQPTLRVDQNGEIYVEYYTSMEIGIVDDNAQAVQDFATNYVEQCAGAQENVSLAVRIPISSIVDNQIAWVVEGDGKIPANEKQIFLDVRAKLVAEIAKIDALQFKD